MGKKDGISDLELLSLVHKCIDMGKLKIQDKTITKKRLDRLFQDMGDKLKKDSLTLHYKPEEGGPVINNEFDLIIVNVDGASRGNPGKSGIGVAIFDNDFNLINEACDYIGIATNNISEYHALLLGIKLSMKYKAKKILFKSDSELLVRQIKGIYKVKNTKLKPLFDEAQNLLKKLPDWGITHIPREENREADLLANKGIEMSMNKALI